MGLLDNKTEAPTPKKRDDARKKGQVAKSRDLVSVVVLLAGFWALKSTAPEIGQSLRQDMIHFLSEATGPDRMLYMQEGLIKILTGSFLVLHPMLLAVMVGAVVANVAQTGPMLIGEPLKVDLKKLNPGTGLKRLFSPTSLAELLKSIAKVGLVSWVVINWLRSVFGSILEMAYMDLTPALAFASQRMVQLVTKTVGTLVIIAIIDYAWQRYQHESQLKMSKDEIRDEFKQQEGSPEVKSAIRRRMREMARVRMMADVPTADVVLTNPTHYSVALKYDPLAMAAPRVVARGMGHVAFKIREIATEHEVPIVENPPLTRALYAACELGDEVPPELYAAVAEVLAFVFRMRGQKVG